jgi:hypothetical protein
MIVSWIIWTLKRQIIQRAIVKIIIEMGTIKVMKLVVGVGIVVEI